MTDARVERLAKVYIGEDISRLPSNASYGYDKARGEYYFKLKLDNLNPAQAIQLISKSDEHFDTEVVTLVEHGDGLRKERRYVTGPDAVPPGYTPRRGKQGGWFYNTEERGVEGPAPEPTPEAEPEQDFGEGWEEPPDKPAEELDAGDMVEVFVPDEEEYREGVIDQEEEGDLLIDTEEGTVRHPETAHITAVADLEVKSDGTLTSQTGGFHNVVYSPRDDEEEEDEEEEKSHSLAHGRFNVDPDEIVYGEVDEEGDCVGLRTERQQEIDKAEKDEWVSYIGPDGGQGWMNIRNGEIRYQKERPGEGPEEFEEGEMAEGWEPVQDPSEIEEGDTIEYRTNDGEYREADVKEIMETILNTTDGPVDPEHVTARSQFDPWAEWYQEADHWDSPAEYWGSIVEEPTEHTDEQYRGLRPGDTLTLDPDFLGPIDEESEVEIMGFWADDAPSSYPGAPVINSRDLPWYEDELESAGGMFSQGDMSPTISPTDNNPIKEESLPDPEEPEDEGEQEEPEPEVQEEGYNFRTDYDPDDVEHWADLGEYGFPSGVTAHAMEVGELPHWDGEGNEGLVFRTNYGEDGAKVDLGHRQMVTYTIGDALGGQMPHHVGHPEENGYVDAEGIDGEMIGSAPEELLNEVEEEEFLQQAAIQIILGNNDAHLQNVLVEPDGSISFIDIDHSAGDITSDFVGNKPQYDSAIDRVLGELWRSYQYVTNKNETEAREALLEEAEKVARSYYVSGGQGGGEDAGFESYEECVTEEDEDLCAAIFFADSEDDPLLQAFEEAMQYKPELVENVKGNIEALATGGL